MKFYNEEELRYLYGSRERGRDTRTRDLQAQFPRNPIVGYKLQKNMREVKGGIVLEEEGCKEDRVGGYCVFMKGGRANGKTGYIDKS